MHYSARVRGGCLVILAFGLFVSRALADFAVCQAGWEWASNSKQQNPCEIAGALEAECQGFSSYVLGPLGQGGNYVTPQKNSTGAQKCECNTVMFSLYMACTACQNLTTEAWSFWRKYCDAVYVTQYPGDIPLNTAVPNWAYFNYTVEDNFDPVAAKAVGDQPESVAPVPSTVSLPDSSTGPSSPSSISMSLNSVSTVSTGGSQQNNDKTKTPVPQTVLPANSTRSDSPSLATSGSTGGNPPNNSQTNKSSDVGAIVGGVIGSLAFLAAAGAGAWIFRRRKASGGDNGRGDLTVTYESVMQPPEMRLYDPSDPFTFPNRVDYGINRTHVSPPNRPQYTGAAEL